MENPFLPIRPALEQAISLLQNAVCQRIGIPASVKLLYFTTAINDYNCLKSICLLLAAYFLQYTIIFENANAKSGRGSNC